MNVGKINAGRPELSIIVPVYNAEKYLHSCMDSIIMQTFTDWELILVDDGSSDGSGKICDAYAAEDSRIRVLHQNNGGACAARNIALDMVRGQYLTFVDSDDEYGTCTTLEVNVQKLKQDSSISVLQFPYVYVEGDRKRQYSHKNMVLCSKTDVYEHFLLEDIRGYLWNKIFKASLFDDIRFPSDISLAEDMYVLQDILDKIDCFCFSEEGQYLYYRREGSITVSKTKAKESDAFMTFRRMLAKSRQYPDADKAAFSCFFFTTLSQLLQIYALWGWDDAGELDSLKQYVPGIAVLNGKLRFKYKLKIIQIKILGLRLFSRFNVYFKRRRRRFA